MIVAGFVKPTRIEPSKASAPAPAGAPALPAHDATRASMIQHRGCRKALRPNWTKSAGFIESDKVWQGQFALRAACFNKRSVGVRCCNPLAHPSGSQFFSSEVKASPADAVALPSALRALTAGGAFFEIATNSVRERAHASVQPGRAIFLYS